MAKALDSVTFIDKAVARYQSEITEIEDQLHSMADLALQDWLLLEACKDYDTIDLGDDIVGKARRKEWKALRDKKRNLEKMIVALQDLRQIAASDDGEKLTPQVRAGDREVSVSSQSGIEDREREVGLPQEVRLLLLRQVVAARLLQPRDTIIQTTRPIAQEPDGFVFCNDFTQIVIEPTADRSGAPTAYKPRRAACRIMRAASSNSRRSSAASGRRLCASPRGATDRSMAASAS